MPSEPTAAFGLLRDLLRLRIAGLFRAGESGRRQGITGFALSAERSKGRDEQAELIRSTKSRDGAAGARAFALIRAELGNDAVRRARVRLEHQPEKQYSWETVEAPLLRAGSPLPAAGKVLVRRIFESPRVLPPAPRSRSYRGCGGPYVVSGGWWSRPYSRRYRFIEATGGTILWIFREGESAPWLVQGLLG